MTERDREQLSRLTPDQRAKLASLKADFKRPEIVEAREAARESLDREFAESGTIETEEDEAVAPDFLAFRAFMGRLRGLRESKGLSIEDVARLSGIERRMISKLELGHNDNPTVRTLNRYCRVLGVSLPWDAAPYISMPEKAVP